MFTCFRPSRAMVASSLAVVLVAAPSPMALAQQSAKLKWGPAPAVFPRGAKMAVVSGDPSKAGPFTAQLSMPNRYRIAPHFHPTDEHIVVKKGTFMLGMGDTMSTATMKTMKVLKPGDSADAKANMHHYAAAHGRTLIEVSANGPFTLTYVNPADDPQKAVAARSKGKAGMAKKKA